MRQLAVQSDSAISDPVIRRSAAADNGPTATNTAAVIVAYHPGEIFGERVRRVARQIGKVIIVDNSGPKAQTPIPSSGDVELLGNEENRGIGCALNQGMRRAEELGFAWVLTLDQDTVVDDDLVENLGEIYRDFPEAKRIGLIGSNARSRISGRLANEYPSHGSSYVQEKAVITSGSLVSMAAYKTVGPFRGEFFIEGVDSEYCLRLRRHGLKVLCSRKALMTHAAGKMQEERLFGRVVLVADHEPWRYYYMVRNFVWIAREYFFDEPLWVLKSLLGFGKMFLKMFLYEQRTLSKCSAAFAGLLSGLLE
jgi:rhamnosyltransferase